MHGEVFVIILFISVSGSDIIIIWYGILFFNNAGHLWKESTSCQWIFLTNTPVIRGFNVFIVVSLNLNLKLLNK